MRFGIGIASPTPLQLKLIATAFFIAIESSFT